MGAEVARGETPPTSPLRGKARLDVGVVDAVLHEGAALGGFDAKLVSDHGWGSKSMLRSRARDFFWGAEVSASPR
jgi:hypothetical protein